MITFSWGEKGEAAGLDAVGGAGVGGVSVGQDRLQDQGAAAVAMGQPPGRQEVHAADNLLDAAVADAGQVLAHLFGHEGEVVYDVFDLALEPAVDQVLAPGGGATGRSRPVLVPPAVRRRMRPRRPFNMRICWVSAKPSSQGQPAFLME